MIKASYALGNSNYLTVVCTFDKLLNKRCSSLNTGVFKSLYRSHLYIEKKKSSNPDNSEHVHRKNIFDFEFLFLL